MTCGYPKHVIRDLHLAIPDLLRARDCIQSHYSEDLHRSVRGENNISYIEQMLQSRGKLFFVSLRSLDPALTGAGGHNSYGSTGGKIVYATVRFRPWCKMTRLRHDPEQVVVFVMYWCIPAKLIALHWVV